MTQQSASFRLRNVLILGSGRSGTSMAAGVLARAGYFMGDQVYPPNRGNPKGQFESREINLLNEDILAPLAPTMARMQRWLARIPLEAPISATPDQVNRIRALVARQPFCFKDPRFSYTLPVWTPHLPDTVMLCVFRDPASTARSILKQFEYETHLRGLELDFAQALQVWELMYRHILERQSGRGRWLFLHYNQILTSEGLDRIAEFTGAAVDRTFPDAKIRRSFSDETVPAQVAEVYAELCRRAEYADAGVKTTGLIPARDRRLRLSVVVCTHRNPQLLDETLTALSRQTLDPARWELVVVDNRSEDSTPQVVRRYPQARYVYEPVLGLAVARNRGIRESTGDIIAFTDDDALPDEVWAEEIIKAFEAHPEAAGAGGPVLPIWDAPPPPWLTPDLHRSLSLLSWGDQPRFLEWPERVIGVNCAFRREVFEQYGGFDPNLGRVGEYLLDKEDVELQMKLVRAGKKVFYNPRAVVRHHVPAARMTREYFQRRSEGSRLGERILELRTSGRADEAQQLVEKLRAGMGGVSPAAPKPKVGDLAAKAAHPNLRGDLIELGLHTVRKLSGRPLSAVEVGCMFRPEEGLSTYRIAKFIKENGGHFRSVDSDPTHIEGAKRMLEALGEGLTEAVEFEEGFSLAVLCRMSAAEQPMVDFVFLDGGAHPEICLQEFEWALEHLAPRGLILIDDGHELAPTAFYPFSRAFGKQTLILPVLVLGETLAARGKRALPEPMQALIGSRLLDGLRYGDLLRRLEGWEYAALTCQGARLLFVGRAEAMAALRSELVADGFAEVAEPWRRSWEIKHPPQPRPKPARRYAHDARRHLIRSREALAEFRNLHRGERCVIVGNGPSLNRMDLDWLKDEVTFGLNKVFLGFDRWTWRPTYMVSVNPLVLEQCARRLETIDCPKFVSLSGLPFIAQPDKFIFLQGNGRREFSPDPRLGVWEGHTVTFVAMQLAYFMGFSEVALIGCDHDFGVTGTPNQEVTATGPDTAHFHPDYFGPGMRWNLPDLGQSEYAYELARRTFEQDGRRIVNATVGGRLEVFPRVDYRQWATGRGLVSRGAGHPQQMAREFNRQGEECFNRGETEAAEAFYRRALEASPDFAAAHCNLGVAAFLKGDAETALEHLKRAAALDPLDRNTVLNVIEVLKAMGRPGDAERCRNEFHNLFPDDPEAAQTLVGVEAEV